MADILATWLNEEVGLSKNVSNFEEDFSSGYLLGELLYKFNQQENFDQFSKKDAISHKLQNFEKLDPTLRNLKIKFDSKSVDKIMKQERGVSLRLLYQLKMVLEKVYPPTDIAVLTKTGKFGDNQPAQKIPMPKEKYDNVQHAFFKQRLQVLNKPQKVLNMEAHVQKFHQERLHQESVAQSLQDQEKQADALRKQEMRRIQINKLQRNAGFMEEWQQKGVDDWKKNQEIKKERENSQLEFDYKQAEKYNNIAVAKLEEVSREVHDGIDAFEQTLKSQGINPRVQKDAAERAVSETLQGSQTSQLGKSFGKSKAGLSKTRTGKAAGLGNSIVTKTGAFTLTSTGLKQRTKKTQTDATRLAREKRRRRLIAQQATVMQELEQQHRESMVLDLMKRQSNQEKELDYESWRTTQCKNIITENRKLRENQYEKRRELDTQTGQFKEEKMLESMQEHSKIQVSEMDKRTHEMRGFETQQKHKNRTELSSALMDAIFDIADEAYNHQQNLDSNSNDTDPRNWHEWTQLFEKNLPIAGTLKNLAELVTEETGGSNATVFEEKIDNSTKMLDELELVDFLKNKGQWPSSLITHNKPSLESIVNPPPETAPTGKGKGGAKAAAADHVSFEEGDLELTDVCDNNFMLGDIIEQIIKLNYEARTHQKHPQTPSWLTLKLCLVGYPFSGKRVQAEMIKQKFGLDTYRMEDLVKEALEFSEQHPEAIPAEEKNEEEQAEEGEKDSSSEGENSDEEIQDCNLPEDFRQCGATMQELLFSGEEINDELYVKLFITKLRMAYPYKDSKTRRKEFRRQARRNINIESRLLEIEEELKNQDLKKKQIKALEQEQESLVAEFANIKQVRQNGWVLVDFPCSYAQAKILEEALSGYKPNAELNSTQREKEIEDAYLLVQPNAKEDPPKMLLPSGLDAVMWFNCPIKEALRRADGRRYDSGFDEQDQQTIYHVNDVLPPVDQAPLCERLEQYSQPENSVSTLVDRCISFNQTTRSMQRWYEKFGDEDNGRQLCQTIDCSRDAASVFGQVRSVIEQILEHKNHRLSVMKEIISFKLKTLFEEKLKQAEDKLAQENAEEEEAPVEASQPELKQADQSKTSFKSQTQLANTSSAMTSLHAPAVLPERDNIDGDFKPVIVQMWKDLSLNYRHQMKTIFRNVRLHREQQFQKYSDAKKAFLDFLHRLDGKQEILNDFVKNFNQFSDQYPDLREDDQTKEELHQRTDVLSDELWEIVEERKEQAIEERKKIMEGETVEFSLNYSTSCAQQLMQAQLDKFKISIQIIHDYYHAIEEKLIPEAPPASTYDLVFEGDEHPAVETLAEGADATNLDSYTYPRLDKLLAMALKQQVVPDVTHVQVQADPKSKGKKDPKKAAQATQEEDKSVEESVYVREMKDAIKTEKSILRYRLVQIRNWTLKNLKDSRRTAIDLYKKLEDWIFVAQKAEMDAIEEMCIVIKDAIEEESKIQDELRINFMDFTVDQGTLNYINPPPPKLEALEAYKEDRFAIPQLHCLLAEFQEFQKQKGNLIQISDFASMLFNKVNNARNFGGFYSALPTEWNDLTQIQLQQISRNLDPNNTGLINWKQAFTYMILLKTPLPNDTEIQAVKFGIPARNRRVLETFFTQATFWFDNSEASVDREYSNVFERVRMIKELLFKTHADSEDMVNIDELADILALPGNSKEGLKTFNDFLFADVGLLQQ